MSVAVLPGSSPQPGFVPYTEYQRVLSKLDETQQKLSAVTAVIQNAGLSWKERATRVATVLALEAQRPRENPRAQFRADLGDLAKRAGLIPPTPDGDDEARSKAWKSGRKLAGQVVKDLAEHGVIEGRFVDMARDEGGEATTSSVVVQIERPHLDVVRALSRMGGTRKLLKPRGIHTKIDASCPECHSLDTDLRCHTCGAITATRDILDAMDQANATGFQRLETLSTREHSEIEETSTDFQSLETGSNPASSEQPDALDELKAAPQWVFWKYRERDGKRTKPPMDPATGEDAKSNDPYTWGTFAAACDAMQRHAGAGVGYMFSRDYVGIDLDACRDAETGAIDTEARRIIDELHSYTEVSPSGTGVHILLRGTLPPGRRRHGSIEMYDGGRYFTVTGRHVEGTPRTIAERTDALGRLHERIFPAPPPTQAPRPSAQRVAPTSDDPALIEQACRAQHPVPFEPLWRGEYGQFASGGESGRHLADYWLCRHLAFWTRRDTGRMDHLFRQSGLMREKWDRPDATHGTYGERTIRKALGDA